MQSVVKNDKGKWVFLCISQKHRRPFGENVYSPPYETEEEAKHALAVHNERNH